MKENRKKIIIDTDCGSDDAMAIAMALNDENYEIVMITTVSGNVRMKQATLNTLTTLKVNDSYYPPVYEGCDEMLVRDWVGAAETHGYDGMGDLGLVDQSLKPQEGHAVLKMLEALRNAEDKEIDIIALGPLTNLALAYRLEPGTMKKVGRIVVMGTAGLGTGNVSPAAEFNIWQDPEACKVMLESGIDPLIFVGWDACLDEAMLNEEEIEKIRNGSAIGRFCIDTNVILMNMNRERFKENCLDMADPAAMAAALYPECIKECNKYYCEVDTANGPSYGGVLVDRYRFSGKKENAYICSKLDPELYKNYIYKHLNVE
ncbi:MAG: nucleoside hydrolase [Erysipelotrichaceae bacterium]|nr:nucleoside hydrolase [Erysipelotrichaceae bacterium]